MHGELYSLKESTPCMPEHFIVQITQDWLTSDDWEVGAHEPGLHSTSSLPPDELDDYPDAQ